MKVSREIKRYPERWLPVPKDTNPAFHLSRSTVVKFYVNDLDNVHYEVINEGGNRDWDWGVVDVVHNYEASKGRQQPVGLTGAGNEKLAEMLASPAEWISPGANDSPTFKTGPPDCDGKKVAVSDTDHLWGHGGTTAWAWKSFLRGYNTLLVDYWVLTLGHPCGYVNWGPRPCSPTRDLNRANDWTWELVRMAI